MDEFMELEMKIHQVLSLGDGMIKIILLRRGLKARIEPITQTEEQRVAQNIAQQLQQTLGKVFPGAVVVGGPGGKDQWDAKVEMDITEEEYSQLGRPGINETMRLEVSKMP